MQFYKTARRLRKELGITQRAMATRLGITAVHLCNIERGHAMPSYRLLDRYADVCQVWVYIGTRKL